MAANIYTADHRFVDDQWGRRDTLAGRLDGEKVLLPPRAYHLVKPEDRDPDSVGIVLAPEDDVKSIANDLEHLGMIAIEFPKFSDGRGYSQAARLRNHHRYQGILRGFGDVLLDQVQFMFRTGFDEMVIVNEPTRLRLEAETALWHHHFSQPDIARAGSNLPAQNLSVNSLDPDQNYVWRHRL